MATPSSQITVCSGMQLIAMLRQKKTKKTLRYIQIEDLAFLTPPSSLCKEQRGLIEIYTEVQKINSNVDNEVSKNNLNPTSA